MYIAIEGVIGVGKTTLARLLKPAFNAEILLEIFEENPFLSDFYGDRERYAFQTQMFFLLCHTVLLVWCALCHVLLDGVPHKWHCLYIV